MMEILPAFFVAFVMTRPDPYGAKGTEQRIADANVFIIMILTPRKLIIMAMTQKMTFESLVYLYRRLSSCHQKFHLEVRFQNIIHEHVGHAQQVRIRAGHGRTMMAVFSSFALSKRLIISGPERNVQK